MVTLKTHQGRLFLNPGEDHETTANFFGYCLARALHISDAELHGAVVMGNHPHVSLTDVRGELPLFKQSLHTNVARGMNARRGRFDSFWSPRGSCDSSRNEDDEALNDLVYILTNPVKAGLFKWGSLWPGFTTYGWRFGETRTFKRPDWFFSKVNPDLPEELSITLKRPPIFLDTHSDDELYDELMLRVRAREREIQAARKKDGKRFMGLKKLLRQKWSEPPRAYQPRFEVAPRVAGTSRWEVAAGLARNKKWEAEYAAAMDAYDDGALDTAFPYGTYFMRKRAHVCVCTGPP